MLHSFSISNIIMVQNYYDSWGEYYNYSGDKKQSLTIHVAKVGASFKHVATKQTTVVL